VEEGRWCVRTRSGTSWSALCCKAYVVWSETNERGKGRAAARRYPGMAATVARCAHAGHGMAIHGMRCLATVEAENLKERNSAQQTSKSVQVKGERRPDMPKANFA